MKDGSVVALKPNKISILFSPFTFCFSKHVGNMSILPFDMLMHIFRFNTKSMFLLNKIFTAEFLKKLYYKLNTNITHFQFGSLFKYQEWVHILTTDLQFMKEVDWRIIDFPNLHTLIISIQSFYPFQPATAYNLLEVAKRSKYLTSFSMVNADLEPNTSFQLKLLQHLKELKLKIMPTNLLEYKSCSTISHISVLRFNPASDYKSEYLFVHSLEISDKIGQPQIDLVTKLFPSLCYLSCTIYTQHMDMHLLPIQELRIFCQSVILPLSLQVINLQVAKYNPSLWHSKLSNSHLRECTLFLPCPTEPFQVSDIQAIKDVFKLLISCPFKCTIRHTFAVDIRISNANNFNSAVSSKSKFGIHLVQLKTLNPNSSLYQLISAVLDAFLLGES